LHYLFCNKTAESIDEYKKPAKPGGMERKQRKARKKKQPMSRLINSNMGLPLVRSLRLVDAVRYVCLAKILVNRKKAMKVSRVKSEETYTVIIAIIRTNRSKD
jgi:hypothetical protein